MPRFLAPITVAQEYVTSNETISGSETILGATSGKDSYWTSVNVVSGLSADHGSFVYNVSALSYYGDGSHLTGIVADYLPLSGGTLTGGVTGTTANFSGEVYGSTAVAGTSSNQLATTAFVQNGLASGSAIASTVVAFVTNDDTVPLTRGTVVYSYGSQGDRVSVRMASASAEATSSKTLGLVNDTIAVGGTGYVTLYGAMDKLDLGSPFVAGDPLWLGTTPGTYTRTKPVAPIHLVYLGTVQRANAGNGTAYIKVQNGYELDELHDVLISNPLSAQILQRNSSNTLWTNQTPLFNDTQIVNSSKWNSTYNTVCAQSAQWADTSPTGSAGGDLNGTYPNPTVAKIQGYTISTATPSIGQMLQWSGTAWVPGSIPNGGSGGGGVTYYLNYGLSADNPVAGLSGTHYELGRFSTVSATSATFTNVSQTSWDTLATFVTDHLDPSIVTLPAGIWDLNLWASSTASVQTQMKFKYELYTYSESLSSTTLIATSDIYNIYDPSVIAQYVVSMIVPQTTIDINSRIFIVLLAQSVSPNKDITIYYNDGRPTHLHSTLPSVGGSGLVKVINGVYQNPGSLLVDVDVADNAQINQTKISGLTDSLDSKFNKTDIIPISAGGTGQNTPSAALSALGGFPITGGTITDGLTANSGTFTTYLSSSSISGTHYGDGSNLTGLNISNISSGVLPISSGGTGTSTIETAKISFGGIQTAQIRHNSNLVLLSAGTISNAVFTAGLSTVTFASTTASLSVGMSFNTGIITGVIKSIDSPTQVTMSVVAGTTQTISTVTVFNVNTTNLTSSSIITMDGRTMVVGDIVILTAQTATPLNGPWRLDSLAGGVMSFSRPSWFSGTLIGPILFAIQYGSGNASLIIAIEPTNASTTTGAIIGIDPVVGIVSTNARANNANTSTNTFTGPQTLRVNGTAINQAPLYFQNPTTANTIMSAAQAHAVEWNGSTMYLTTGATYTGSINGSTLFVTATSQGMVILGATITGGTIASGTTITGYISGIQGGVGAYTVTPSQTATSTTITSVLRSPVLTNAPIPTSSTSMGLLGQIAYDINNIYICISANTWRKAALTTF